MAKQQKPRHPLADARMTADLAAYDVIVIDSSAGKDSQAMLDLVVEQATAVGVRERLVVVHCDLGRVEWEGTKELAERQAKHYGLRFEVVSRPQGDLLEHVESKGKWPGFATRFCTSDHKTSQVEKLFTKLVDELGATRTGVYDSKLGIRRPARILDCLGLRAQESDKRADQPQLQSNERASNGKRAVDTWLPIKWWSTEDVWRRIAQSGVEHHYAYDLGMPRLSCCFCIYASPEALLLAGYHNRAKLAEYVRVEQKIDHKFTVAKGGGFIALADIQATLAAGYVPAAVETWNDCAA